jgi:hypothetical protein
MEENQKMAKFLSGIAIALTLSSLSVLSVAQSPAAQTSNTTNNATQAESSQASHATNLRMAPGSVIPVQLTKTVDVKKAKTGEQVTAKVLQDLKASNGMMLMPKDTEIVGHITEAQPKNKQDKESQVGIVFDHAVTQGGNVSYPLSIQAVISPTIFQRPNNNGSEGATQAPSSSMPTQTPGEAGRGMGSGQGAPSNAPPGGSAPENSGSQNGSNSNSQSAPPKITGQTQGVLGFSHMKLETPTSAAQPSVISSQKNNVKLQNGTLMLLRVNQ